MHIQNPFYSSKMIIVLLLYIAKSTIAQQIDIRFAATGESNSIETIEIENLTQETSMEISGSDVLRLVGVVGISEVDYDNGTQFRVYPNPCHDQTTLDFTTQTSENALIEVYDLSGHLITSIAKELRLGNHKFTINNLFNGIYFINIKTKNRIYTHKILSTGKGERLTIINYAGFFGNSIQYTESKSTREYAQMQFNMGDQLLCTVMNGNFSTIHSFSPTSDSTILVTFIEAVDGDGNYYPTVKIGDQLWMASNLKTTKFNDGSSIAYPGEDSLAWVNNTSGAYAWYNNFELSFKNTFGGLYNWYCIDSTSNGGKNICPIGWRIPTYDDWSALNTYLGDTETAGGLLKSTGFNIWLEPNPGATNQTGFTAIPSGSRDIRSYYHSINRNAFFWSSSYIAFGYYALKLNYNNAQFDYNLVVEKRGYSVRCIK